MKTEFIEISQGEKKETVFTHYLCGIEGWLSASEKPSDFEKVVYLGNCKVDGDLFALYNERERTIDIFKGKKGGEFK